MYNIANELRPKTLDQIIGQENTVQLLKEVAKNKLATSFIFFGESGTGKTSAAVALANDMNLKYSYFNSTIESKNDLMNKINNSDILIIDEIHRLNKDKQDILLSYLEFDKIIVYATTTENPYFRVNPALRSRMQIVRFEKINEHTIAKALEKVVQTHFPYLDIGYEELLDLSRSGAGDYRSALNNLQMLAMINNKKTKVDKETIKKIIPNVSFYSDMESSAHYNNLSAFHKSLRGSDPDAALYYGALILKSGDFQGLFRRMLCVAYEDIGMANPNVSIRVNLAFDAVEKLGFPEANLPIGFAIVDLALSPKSNSTYKAFSYAQNLIEDGKIYPIPNHLKDSHYKTASKLGDGIGYKYPHDFPNNHVKQNYLPKQLLNTKIYEFGANSNEQKIKQYWEQIKKFNSQE